MNFFKKKETLIQNITFMAVMAAINIIISVISSFSLIASVFLIIFLPLTSTLVELFCKTKFFIIYAIATIGLSLVATLWNTQTTLFYVIPSILTGFVFGFISKKNIHPFWCILISSIIQASLTFAFIPLINFLYGVNIIDTFKKAFNLINSQSVDIIIPAFIFAISFIQIILSYVVVSSEIKKFGFKFSNQYSHLFICSLVNAILVLSLFGFYFISLEICYVILIITIYFGAFQIIEIIYMKQWGLLILSGVIVLINIFIFAIFFSKLKQNAGMLLISVTPFLISIETIFFSLLNKNNEKIK